MTPETRMQLMLMLPLITAGGVVLFAAPPEFARSQPAYVRCRPFLSGREFGGKCLSR